MSEQASGLTKLAKALLAVQKEVGGVSKDSVNPHFKSRYADLTAVIEAAVPVFNKHGVVVLQAPVPPPYEGYLALNTTLMHDSGESISGTAVIPLSKNDPQAYGSAMTYARRYSLASIIGLKTLDDDAEAAVGRGEPADRSTPPPPPPHADRFRLGGKAPAPVKALERGKSKLFPTVNATDAEGGEQ